MATSRPPILLAIVLALLLLGTQREVQVHALQHLGGALHPAQEQGFQSPATAAACLECSLLAGGSSVLAADRLAPPAAGARAPRALRAVAWRPLAAPSYYSSRAPPPLL